MLGCNFGIAAILDPTPLSSAKVTRFVRQRVRLLAWPSRGGMTRPAVAVAYGDETSIPSGSQYWRHSPSTLQASTPLQSVFIEHLAPWPAIVRPSNTRHAAIADFLTTRAAVAGISSNYDTLIESRAWDYGAGFRGSLDSDEATADSVRQAPGRRFAWCRHRMTAESATQRPSEIFMATH